MSALEKTVFLYVKDYLLDCLVCVEEDHMFLFKSF